MIYFDNAATTKPCNEALEMFCDISKDYFGNPSSLHHLGVEAERVLALAAREMARFLSVTPEEIIFTSGGTESNNTALFGVTAKHIITTETEHPSVLEAAKFLESKGTAVTYLGVDAEGYVDADALGAAMRPETGLVSIHHVNNETGAVQDIEKLAAVAKKQNSGVVFHSDGVQAFGKYGVNAKNIDLYSASAHKIHAPKGVGFLCAKKGKLKPMLHGGGQQRNLRPGTENVAGVAAFACAAKQAHQDCAEKTEQVKKLKLAFVQTVLSEMEDCYVNGNLETDSAYILNMSFEGVKAEVLLHILEADGIYVSTGSACNSKKKKFGALGRYGLSNARVESALRFSFSAQNTRDEVDFCIERLKKHVEALRKVRRNR